jgi:diadenosine tetraphosphate (Ap4A) HIT family hydrolase
MSSIEVCPFCNLHERILKKNDLAHLFLSNPRKVEGHFLVAPKRHVEQPWELTKKEIQSIFELIFFVQEKIAKKLAQGCDVRQNYRPFLKQGRIKVDHVHYHVIPRNFNDTIYTLVEKEETSLFQDLSDEEQTKMTQIITG